MEEKQIKSRTSSSRPGGSPERKPGDKVVRKRPTQSPSGERKTVSRPAKEAVSRDSEGKPKVRKERPAGTQEARAKSAKKASSQPKQAQTRTVKSQPPASRRRPQSKRRRKRNLFLRVSLLIILLVAAVVGAFLWKKYSPSKEKADLNEYYGIEKEEQVAIIVDNQVLAPQGMIADGKAYVQYEIVRDFINSRFYWDPSENILLYTLPNDVITVDVGSKEYSISKKKESLDYVILKTDGSTAYIALDFIKQYTNMDYAVYEEPDRITISTVTGDTLVAEVKKDTQVRYRGGVKSPILTEVTKKDVVTILESEENWKKVCTEDGFVGYIANSTLKKEKTKTITREFTEPEYTNITKDYIINMAWHNVTNTTANSTLYDRLAGTKGINTIAPTWYHVADTSGNLSSISSADYVNFAHQANIEVWATLRDFDGGISSYDESLEFLSSTSSRTNLINKLIADVLQVGVDGINVDFEKISDECGEHYIQFIRELSIRCRQNGIVLSVDNYVPKGYNMQYDRKEQGIVADYVVIMGYDEHFAGSKEVGSVSSYNYVKEGIEATLDEVPAEKVISGIPFFTRLWKETPKTEAELAEDAGTDDAEYMTNVSSQALGMSVAKDAVSAAGAELTWDEEAQQEFATWEVDGVKYSIWLENEKSLEPKLKLMKDNKLAGTAAWALGQESSGIWDLILQYTN